jgi:hypothetical protein
MRRSRLKAQIEAPLLKKCLVYMEIVYLENPPYMLFPAAVDHMDLRIQTVSLLWLRPSSGMHNVAPRPKGCTSPAWLFDG